jgi:hypothetical protein
MLQDIFDNPDSRDADFNNPTGFEVESATEY